MSCSIALRSFAFRLHGHIGTQTYCRFSFPQVWANSVLQAFLPTMRPSFAQWLVNANQRSNYMRCAATPHANISYQKSKPSSALKR